jgi:hypothetical protein
MASLKRNPEAGEDGHKKCTAPGASRSFVLRAAHRHRMIVTVFCSPPVRERTSCPMIFDTGQQAIRLRGTQRTLETRMLLRLPSLKLRLATAHKLARMAIWSHTDGAFALRQWRSVVL